MAVLWVRGRTMRLLRLRWLRLIPWGCILCPAARSSVHTLPILWFQYACNGENWCLLLIISVCIRERRNEAAVTPRSHTCLYLKTLVSFYHPLGTEPWSFYFINGFLNFNVAFILALLVLPLTCLMECLLQKFHGEYFMVSVRQLESQAQRAQISTLLLRGQLTCQSSFSLLEVKLGSRKVFRVIGKFLELITQFSIDPTTELLCRKNRQ